MFRHLCSVFNDRREGEEKSSSIVVAETMKLLENSSYGCQIMDRIKHTVTKSLSDGKTHAAIENKLFRRLGFVSDQLYEVELVKSGIEHKEPMIFGLKILLYAKLRMLELYSNLFDKYCDVTKFEERQMDTDLLYLTLLEHYLYNCVRPAMKTEWNSLRSGDCTDEISTNASTSFFRTYCTKHKKHDRKKTWFIQT